MNKVITVLRKPLEGTVSLNVLKYGTGALNIDAARIPISDEDLSEMTGRSGAGFGTGVTVGGYRGRSEGTYVPNADGRWPANLILTSNAVSGFPDTGPSPATYTRTAHAQGQWLHAKPSGSEQKGYGDQGGTAARFFYVLRGSQ